MNTNIGKTDKVIRIVLGVIILALGIIYQSWWGLIGLIPLVTAFVGKCLIYMPFGISTCKTEDTAESKE